MGSVLLVTDGKQACITTDGGGVNRINPKTKEVRQYLHDPSDERTIGSGSRANELARHINRTEGW